MPDDGPGADQQVHEVDELAKGLPGLPVEFRNCRVDETGIYHKPGWLRTEAHIAWGEISAFVVGEYLHVGVAAEHPQSKTAQRIWLKGKRRRTRAVKSAWREYLLREAERDGVLKGTVRARVAIARAHAMIRTPLVFVACLLFGLAYFVVWPWMARAREGKPFYFPEAALVACVWFCVYAITGIVVAVYGLLQLRSAREFSRRWKRWELRKGGLVFWPDDAERCLTPAPGDIVTPSGARIAAEQFEFDNLARRDVVMPVLLAMSERARSDIRLVDWSRCSFAVDALLILAALATGAWARALVAGWEEGIWQMVRAAGVLSVLGIAGFAVWHILGDRALKRTLSEGRAMLERLGW